MAGALVEIGTWNMGPGSDMKKIKEIIGWFEDGMDVLGTQEASDRDAVKRGVSKHPSIGCFERLAHGSPAVPIFYNSARWRPFASGSVLLSPRFFAPEGVGPNWVKPKRLNFLFLRDKETHDALVVGNMHMPASLWADRRNVLGRRVVQHAADWAAPIALPVVITADWNTKVGSSILSPLAKAHLHSCQEVRVRQSHGKLKPLATHGGWTPDDIWKKRLHVNEVEAHDTTSDHRILVMRGQLR